MKTLAITCFVQLVCFVLFVDNSTAQQIEPNWESMEANYRVPDWFVDGKLGVWFHWGIPSSIDDGRPHDGSHYGAWMYGTEGQLSAGKHPEAVQRLTDWHNEHYGHYSKFGYEDLIPNFKAENWDPDALVRLVKDVGAHFIMPVACHHDNFDMYDSSHPWNSVDMGPKRDTLLEWKAAAQKHGLKFGVSTHLYWSPRFFNSARKVQTPGTLASKLFSMDYDPRGYSRQDSWNEHWYARCWEIIEKYDPDMFNNDSPYPNMKTGKGLGVKLFSNYVKRDLEENNGKQSVVLSFKDITQSRKAFTYNMERGSAARIEPEPWMWATDLCGIWFYRDGVKNRMSIPVMLGNAVDSISKNGVVMLNVALKGDGTIPDNQMEYLTAFGQLFRTNGEGLYRSRPWKVFGEGPLVIKDGRGSENNKAWSQEDIRFTQNDDDLYAFVLAPPTEDILIKTLAKGGLLTTDIESITLLGSDEDIDWDRSDEALTIKLPKQLPKQPIIGFKITCQSTVSLGHSSDTQTLEPLEASKGGYTEAAVDHFLKKNDKDGNGKFEQAEDAAQWKRNRGLDKNRDGALDREELPGVLKYVDSPGKQLCNVCFKRVGTRKVYLDFYFPDVDESENKPVVIYTHGGGWAAGSKHGAGNGSFNVVHRALLKRGFCVVSVGYRLVPNSGESAMRDCVVDAKDALRFVSAYRKELGIDPHRIFTFGDSAGGQLAQMLLLSPPESQQGDPGLANYSYKTVAGVSWYGPCDFEDEQLFNHDDRADFRDRFGPRILGKDSKPEDKLKLYREMSPINYLTKKSPPLLMIQGDKDTTIPVKHAYHMQKKAKELKAPVEILIVNNAGHNWRKVDAEIEPARDEIVEQTIQFLVNYQ